MYAAAHVIPTEIDIEYEDPETHKAAAFVARPYHDRPIETSEDLEEFIQEVANVLVEGGLQAAAIIPQCWSWDVQGAGRMLHRPHVIVYGLAPEQTRQLRSGVKTYGTLELMGTMQTMKAMREHMTYHLTMAPILRDKGKKARDMVRYYGAAHKSKFHTKKILVNSSERSITTKDIMEGTRRQNKGTVTRANDGLLERSIKSGTAITVVKKAHVYETTSCVRQSPADMEQRTMDNEKIGAIKQEETYNMDPLILTEYVESDLFYEPDGLGQVRYGTDRRRKTEPAEPNVPSGAPDGTEYEIRPAKAPHNQNKAVVIKTLYGPPGADDCTSWDKLPPGWSVRITVLLLSTDTGMLDPETLKRIVRMRQRPNAKLPLRPRPHIRRKGATTNEAMAQVMQDKRGVGDLGAFSGDGGVDPAADAVGPRTILRVSLHPERDPMYEQTEDGRIIVLSDNLDKQPAKDQERQREQQRHSIAAFVVRHAVRDGKAQPTERQRLHAIAMGMLRNRAVPAVPDIEWIDAYNTAFLQTALQGRPDVHDIDPGGT